MLRACWCFVLFRSLSNVDKSISYLCQEAKPSGKRVCYDCNFL